MLKNTENIIARKIQKVMFKILYRFEYFILYTWQFDIENRLQLKSYMLGYLQSM